MLGQLLVGALVSIGNIAIHATVMTLVVGVARSVALKSAVRPAMLLTGVMIATVSVLMAAHIVEVTVWSLAYLAVKAAPNPGRAVTAPRSACPCSSFGAVKNHGINHKSAAKPISEKLVRHP